MIFRAVLFQLNLWSMTTEVANLEFSHQLLLDLIYFRKLAVIFRGKFQ